jgi:hypothetical protein
MVMAALSVAACSASQSRSDAGQIQTDAAGMNDVRALPDAVVGDDAIPAGGFITGDVDGVTIRGEMLAAAYRYDGLQVGWIQASARAGDWAWAVGFLNNTGSQVKCAGGNVLLLAVTGSATSMNAATYYNGGDCTDEVTHPAPNVGDWLDGTFTATLVTMDGKTKKTVTNGAFHVPRVADQP